MLTLTIGADKFFDENTGEFFTTGGTVIELEHSLFSLSKWESKYEKSFINSKEKTPEEIMDYIRMMVVSPTNVDERVFTLLTVEDGETINDYIASAQTATTIAEKNDKSREIITAEIIYYWMVASQVPFETQYWHLNRLLTLLKVCSEKSNPPKKMSKAEIAAKQREINAMRRAKTGSKG